MRHKDRRLYIKRTRSLYIGTIPSETADFMAFSCVWLCIFWRSPICPRAVACGLLTKYNKSTVLLLSFGENHAIGILQYKCIGTLAVDVRLTSDLEGLRQIPSNQHNILKHRTTNNH